MIITAQCPGCDKPYSINEKYAGRKVPCPKCGQTMVVPAAEGAPPAAARLRVACENCGKGHFVAAGHAGKKTVCKSCGATFRIPSGSPSTARGEPVPSPSGGAAAKAALAPAPPAPEALDVYGLEEEPVAPQTPGGPSSGAALPTVAAGDGDAAPPPPRMKAYKPLSEAQKKKIAKRADKLDRTRPSNATLGVSFGAVLAFALVGWRMYRIMNRFQRAAARAEAQQSAPADVEVMDPRTAAAETDKEVTAMIAQPSTAEARDWLDPAKYPNHAVMEMSPDRAREMVAGFYERGAVKVYVLDPTLIGGTLLTAQIAVQLPQDPAQRKPCLEWAVKYEEGAQPSPDVGQKYLLITTD
jgi:ribosomal protein S27E